MNNWRLLLFALVAVFQPIASFTERSLVDGRQECCDQLSSPLRDTRSSFHGTHRLEKTTAAALRHLYDRDEIRQGLRNELRQQNFEYRLERRSYEQSSNRFVDVHERDSNTKVRHLRTEHLTDRAVDRTSTTHPTQERRNDRNFDTSRGRIFRDDHSTERNERQSKNSFDSQLEIPGQQIRSPKVSNLRLTLNRDAQHVLRQSTRQNLRQSIDEESLIGAAKNMNNRAHMMRVRYDSRRNIDNSRERRQLVRDNEQRRSLSENRPLVQRIRDMRIRINFREENRENRQRLSVERFSVRHEQRDDRRESRQHNKENTDRNLFGERMQTPRRVTRESRNVNKINNQSERNVYSRPETEHQEMMGTGHRETRDEIREKSGHRLSRQILDRRNNRESKIMSTFNRRHVDSRRENRNNARIISTISRENNDERENHNNLLERIQMERPNFRDFNNVITRNGRDSTKAIRYNRLSRETRQAVRENSDQRYSRDMVQMQQRNIREYRIINTQSESVDGQQQIRYNEKRSTEIRREIREYRDHRLHSVRIQMGLIQNRELRIINTLNERGLEIRPEVRQERLYREIRDEIRDHSDRRVVRERRQVDRRDIHESRIINGMATGNARETESKREIRYNERLSRQVRDDQFTRESRVESMVLGRKPVNEERDNSVPDRRTRQTESRNFRQIRSEAFRSRLEHRDNIENREREAIEAHSRNVEMIRNRDIKNHVMVGKVDPENDSTVGNWQYVLYALQSAYLCTLFMHILTPSRSEKPHKMNLRWLRVSSYYNPIKVD